MSSPTRASPTIEISSAPAVLEWESDGGEKCFLSDPDPRKTNLTFEAQIDEECDENDTLSCFLWIRIPIQLKNSDGKHIYAQIHPRSIVSLAYETNVSAPDVVLGKLATNIGCLIVGLLEPVDIVIPADTPLKPNNRRSGQVLDAIRSLGRATSLTLYVPAAKVSKLKFERICAAVTSGHGLQALPRYTDLASLFGGRGGKLLDLTAPATPDDKGPPLQDSPPPYDELGPRPPPPPLKDDAHQTESNAKGKKRRRPRSSGSSASEPARANDFETQERKLGSEAYSQKVIQELRAELRAQREQIQALQEQVQALDRLLEKQQRLTRDIDGQLSQVCGRVDKVEDNVDALDVDVQEHKSDIDGLEARVERIEQEELDEMEARIKQDLNESVTETVLDSVREHVVNSEVEATVKLKWAKT